MAVRDDDHGDRKTVFPRELEVALVVRRHRHNGARAVLGEHEIRDPDRHVAPGKRVDGCPAGVEAFLLDRAAASRFAIERTERRDATAKRLGIGALDGNTIDHRMLGREQHERRAVNRVDPRREDLDALLEAGDRKRQPRAFGATDPIPLHDHDFLGPLGQRVEALEQFIGVRRDPEEPLLEIARHHGRSAAPARAVHDLLVGQHRLAARTPVDGRALAVRESALEHLEENPLVELVVRRQARRDLALPGVANAETLQLSLHVGDVVERRLLRVRPRLDGRILGRQTECVPAEGMEHVVSAHPLGARADVADDVVAHVPDVRVA